MTTQVSSSTRELESAFQTFNQLSEQLISSYHDLEKQAAQLKEELAAAHNERLVQLAEKERLAKRLTNILNALPAGVVVLDGNGRVQQCNPSAIELLGEPIYGEVWRDIIHRAFAPRSDDGHDISLQDGRRVNISTNSLVSEPGQILLIKDVTENRALQENLNRYQRLSAMGEMAASLAHQIRTPLSSALLYTSHLKRPEIPTSERMRCVEKIQLRMRHLESLIKDMLMFARGGCAGEEQIPLSGLLQELEQMASGMNGSYVEIQFVDQAPQAQLRGNREVLLSGLQNLITNAIQSMEQAQQENKKITVLATKAWDDAVDIKVIDNGPGIPEAIQERLLEPFFTTRAQGTGLGLPVVDAIARAHNGCLWFETHSGEGSTFALHLPMTTNEKSVNQSRDRNEHKQKMSKEI